MGISLLKLVKKAGDFAGGVERQVNPFDSGATFGNVHPQQGPARPGNIVSRGIGNAVAQINPFDNGRTWQNPNATNNRSIISQATHSGPSNTIGDLLIKPFVINPTQNIIETGRMGAAELTHNIEAQNASQRREAQNLRESLPGSIGKLLWNTGDTIRRTPQQVVTDIHGFQGNAPTPDELANQQAGLKSFQGTPFGMSSGLAERAITSNIAGAKEQAMQAGYDPNAGIFKQAIIDPVQAALLTKGGETAVRGAGKHTANLINNHIDSKFGQIVANQSLQMAREQAIADATSAPKVSVGMAKLRVAEGGIKSAQALAEAEARRNAPQAPGQLTAPVEPKLLPAPAQNFTMPKHEVKVESDRIHKGTEQLAKEYTQEWRDLSKEYHPTTEIYREALQALDDKYVARHSDLLDKVGEFADQHGKSPKALVKSTPPKAVPFEKMGTPSPKPKAVRIRQAQDAGKSVKVSVNPVKLPKVNEVLGKQTNALDRARTIGGVLEKMGGASKDIANALHRKREAGEIGAAKARAASPVTMGLRKRTGGRKTFSAAVDHLEGKAISTDPKVIKVANEMKAQFDKVHKLASKVGIKFPKRENYFPHYSEIPKSGSSGYQSAVDHLIKSGQVKTEADAVKALEYSRKLGLRHKFASFEKNRTADLPDYPKTKAVYKQYLEQAYDQIAHAQHFGAKDEILDHFINKVSEQSGADAAKKALELFNEADKRKDHSDSANKVSNAVTSFEGSTKLGSSFIGNLAQQVNTAVAGGVTDTVENMAKVLSKKDEDFLNKTGVGDEGVTRESIESRSGIHNDTVRKYTAPLFGQVESFNRRVSALTGRGMADKLTAKYNKAKEAGDTKKAAKIESQLRDRKKGFDVQGEIGKTLTEDQQISAARSFVHRTQFRTDAQDLPQGSTSPVGRVVTQFRRYPYKQTQFLKREVLDSAAKGNIKPLVRVATLGPAVGAGTSALRDTVNQRDSSSDSKADKALNIASAGGFTGLETSLGKNLLPKGSDTSDKYVVRVGKQLGGPAVSDVINAVGSVKNKLNAERFATSHIPVVGQTVTNKLLPYKSAKTSAGSQSTKDNKAAVLQSFDKKSQDFLKMNADDQANAINQDSSLKGIKERYDNAIKTMNSSKATAALPDGLKDDDKKTLLKYENLTSKGKDAFNEQPGNKYAYDKANLEKQRLEGSLKPDELLTKQRSLLKSEMAKNVPLSKQSDFFDEPMNKFKLALAQYRFDTSNDKLSTEDDFKAKVSLVKLGVAKDYTKEVNDLYGMSKRNLGMYINDNNISQSTVDKLYKLDQAMVDAGVIDDPKYKNGLTGSSSSGGRKTISVSSHGALPTSVASTARAVAVHKVAVKARNRSSGNAKVTVRKSKV